MPDSAPTASAWSSGIKTLDGRLGQGPSSGVTVPGTNFKTYMEIARDRGMATGNVSTAEITDATPAGPSSHISQRGCQGPNDTRTACPTETKAAGGLGSIAEQQADEKFDVVLGGGRARYAQPLDAGGTKNVIDYAKEKGYKYVATKDELNAVTSLGAGERLLGLFHDSNMTTEYNALIASDTGAGSPTTKCTPSEPRHRAEPEGDDRQGHQAAAGQPEGLRAPGRGRLDRQARPLRRRLRPDRRAARHG